jgi:hypothetical protein
MITGSTCDDFMPACQFCGNPHSNSSNSNKPTIYMAPLPYHGLEKAVILRASAMKIDSENEDTGCDNPKKRTCDDLSDEETNCRAAYLTYCQGRDRRTSSSSSAAFIDDDDELHRTGRWNDEEVQFVDHLVLLFDQGLLPIPNDTKLSTFLGDMLLCKPSRLTKKMKNAKLSSRSFAMSSTITRNLMSSTQVIMSKLREDCRLLSGLQEQFIASLTPLSAQHEMRFNLQKHWRNYLSNLLVDLSYGNLEVCDFLQSLEEQEARATQAEATMRNVRRRKLGLGSSVAAVPRPMSTASLVTSTSTGSAGAVGDMVPNSTTQTSTTNGMDGVSLDMDGCAATGVVVGNDDLDPDDDMEVGEDFDSAMKFLMGQDSLSFLTGGDRMSNQPHLSDFRDWSTASNPFLAAISNYLEERNLPFQYVDCWVPSVAPTMGGRMANDTNRDVCLLPAGFVTRDDHDTGLNAALVAFGEYSKSFSFKPGKGLPGRVYVSGEPAWQLCLGDAHPAQFARVGGAKVFGLKTACAVPFSAPGVGRMVVVLYSTDHIPQDECLAKLCADELAQFEPTPRWKLVIEIGSGQDDGVTAAGSAVNTSTVHESNDNDCMNSSMSVATGGSSSPVSQYQSTGVMQTESITEGGLERRLISLLGDQMPAWHSSAQSGQSSSAVAGDVQELLPCLMRMRLLLLRPVSRRSSEEKDVVDIVKSSFRNYVEESKRSDSEIAMLLAREWQCLQSLAPTSPSLQGTPSVAMPPPSSTFSASGINDPYQSQALDSLLTYATSTGDASMSKALSRPSFALPPLKTESSVGGGGTDGTMICYDHGKTRSVSVGDHPTRIP